MILPTIHLNGTSREELVRLRREACAALRRAIEALAEMSPNARDYYVARAGAMSAAMEQHYRRIEALREVYRDIEAEAIALIDNEGGRS